MIERRKSRRAWRGGKEGRGRESVLKRNRSVLAERQGKDGGQGKPPSTTAPLTPGRLHRAVAWQQAGQSAALGPRTRPEMLAETPATMPPRASQFHTDLNFRPSSAPRRQCKRSQRTTEGIKVYWERTQISTTC